MKEIRKNSKKHNLTIEFGLKESSDRIFQARPNTIYKITENTSHRKKCKKIIGQNKFVIRNL